MENQYIKQFPDLMKGKKIMYVHGFLSSAQSGTVRRISLTFPQAEVIARDLPPQPEEAMALLRALCEAEQPHLIIGTSMGGMLAEMLYGYDRILVNPAFRMGETMAERGLLGKQRFTNARADGQTELMVTKTLQKSYRDMTQNCFLHAADKGEQSRVFGLFGDQDDTGDNYPLFRAHYPNAIHFHGGHHLSDASFMSAVVPVVRWIDDKQQGRERQIVYIDYPTLMDSYGHQRSSMNKCFKALVERYSVYITAPAPTALAESMAQAARWVEENLSVPAWNRVIYTCNPALLYGDFRIALSPSSGFMGTEIALGSDAFKTWEDIIVYFERLQGIAG